MRLTLVALVAGVASLFVGAFGACSTFTGSETTSPEAGSDATAPVDGSSPGVDAAVDAAVDPGVDAGLPPTPGKIDCFGAATCNKDTGDSCCLDLDAGTKSCAVKCTVPQLTIGCDDKGDCAPGEFCCVGFFGSAECSPACNATNERICHVDSECEKGTTCLYVPCRCTTIGVCGPPGNYVKSFCNLK